MLCSPVASTTRVQPISRSANGSARLHRWSVSSPHDTGRPATRRWTISPAAGSAIALVQDLCRVVARRCRRCPRCARNESQRGDRGEGDEHAQGSGRTCCASSGGGLTPPSGQQASPEPLQGVHALVRRHSWGLYSSMRASSSSIMPGSAECSKASLWGDILREFREHAAAEFYWVFLVHRDARHSSDRVAAQCRELVDDIEGAPVRRTALASTSTLTRPGATTGHDGSVAICC
jgi:hypothetical protein